MRGHSTSLLRLFSTFFDSFELEAPSSSQRIFPASATASASATLAPSGDMAAHSGWCKSTCKAEHLLPFCNSKILPEKAENQWRIPGVEGWPMPRRGEFVVFTSFLERGLSFPTSRFLRQFLSFYRIKISDLGPHSVQQIAFFMTLCEGFLGCPPYFPLWLILFHGRA